jgi:glycine oxidase
VLLAAITADLLANAMTDDRSSAADEDLVKAFHWKRFQRSEQNKV